MKRKQLGQLPPQYDFFLNPYDDLRFTRCPNCEAKTGQRKLPLVIWVDPHYPVSLNYTCRYCKNCDLLIAHKNEIGDLLAQLFRESNPKIIGNDYTVLGTMERPAWKQGVHKPIEFQDLPAYLHDFNRVLKFNFTGPLSDQEQEVVDVMLPPGAGHKDSPASSRESPSNLLIDNIPKAMALLEKMRLALPITVRPSKDLIHVLKKQGIQLDRYRDVQIKDVFYMGDEGGITCEITPPGKEKTPILCSLTHLVIRPEHPLFGEIRAYQEQRERKLAKDYGLAGVTVTPRKRH
jgi:hypothetical protein